MPRTGRLHRLALAFQITFTDTTCINTLRPDKNSRQFADVMFNTFHSMKSFVFDTNFTGIVPGGLIDKYVKVGTGNGFASNWRQVITWSNDDHILRRNMKSLGHIGLTTYNGISRSVYVTWTTYLELWHRKAFISYRFVYGVSTYPYAWAISLMISYTSQICMDLIDCTKSFAGLANLCYQKRSQPLMSPSTLWNLIFVCSRDRIYVVISPHNSSPIADKVYPSFNQGTEGGNY